jgi:hypothetical protein
MFTVPRWVWRPENAWAFRGQLAITSIFLKNTSVGIKGCAD